MTEDKKTEKTAEKKSQFLADVPRGIPVKVLRLVKTMQLPGHGSTDSVQAQVLANKTSWTIEYIAQIRHHKITFTDPGREDRCKTAFVHESRVDSWEPAAL